MKRTYTQTATRTIWLTREITVEFPRELHPDLVDGNTLDALLADADVEWEVDDEDLTVDGTEWLDAEDDAETDVVYEE